jgi:CheY-like chemotaxis protein
VARVLLIEDDADIREGLAELLREVGHDVKTATDGAEALATLRDSVERAEPPCLILLDLMMPVMNGWDFRASQLKAPSLAGIPVVLVSGAADVKQHAERLCAVGYLTKPVGLNRLYELIDANC